MSAELFHIESEQSVLGGLMADPNCFDRIDWLKDSDFYREEHRIIFRHITALLAANKAVDVVTVAESIASAGIEEDYIGLAYLGELVANTPSAANIKRYAEIVSNKRLLRDLLQASNEIADLAQHGESMPIEERLNKAESIVYAIAERKTEGTTEPVPMSSFLSDLVADIDARYQHGGEIVGLSTGLADLDKKTCGLQQSDLIIVAGRPSMGKTALAMNIAEHVALHENLPVVVFSMEMGRKQLGTRSLASVGSIPMNALRTGQLTDDHFSRMTFALGKLANSKIHIDDSPALRVSQMRSRTRRIAKRTGVALIVVDYIQLAAGDIKARDSSSREQEVSSISRGLKAMAKEFNCPVVALSQLSRKCEDRGDKRPVLSDLRESGAIEQDADLILFVYRDEVYHQNSIDKGIAEIIIGKQRQGEIGTVKTLFRGEFSKFYTLTYEAQRELEARHAAEKPMKYSKGMQ